MSFSSDCKKELCLLNPEKPCCRMSELSALYMTLGSLNLLGRGKLSVQFTGESMAVARRVYTLLQKGLNLSPQIHYVSTAHFGGTRKCVLTLGPTQTPDFLSALGMMTVGEGGETTLRSTSPRVNLNRSCCVRAFHCIRCGTARCSLLWFATRKGRRPRPVQRNASCVPPGPCCAAAARRGPVRPPARMRNACIWPWVRLFRHWPWRGLPCGRDTFRMILTET